MVYAGTASSAPPMPPPPSGGACEQQDRQNNDRSYYQREKKSAEEPHSAVDAAESGEHAKDYIENGFEHEARFHPATVLSRDDSNKDAGLSWPQLHPTGRNSMTCYPALTVCPTFPFEP